MCIRDWILITASLRYKILNPVFTCLLNTILFQLQYAIYGMFPRYRDLFEF
jgi:hypothetical protein